MSDKKGFFGWHVVIGAFLIMSMPFGIIFLSHSIFLSSVTQALGITATQFSLVFTIVGLSTGIMSPIMGRIMRKYSIRVIMLVCSIITSLSFAAFGVATELWQIYLLSVIVGIAATGVTQVPISYVLANWFPSKKKGLVTGIAFAGGNIGSFLVIQATLRAIPVIGYQKCYFILGALMIVITIPTTLFLIKGKPSDVGQVPYGFDEDVSDNSKEAKKEKAITGVTFAEAKKTPLFWIFILAIVFLGIIFAGVRMHIPNYMESVGHQLGFVTTITSVISLLGLVSNVIVGSILEKLGLSKGMLVVGGFMTLGIVALIFGTSSFMMVLVALFYGFFCAIASMGPSYLTSEMFGTKDFAAIFGIVMMFFQFGGAIGPAISGFIFDTTGSYNATWVIYTFISIFTFGVFLLSIKLSNKNKNNKEEKDLCIE